MDHIVLYAGVGTGVVLLTVILLKKKRSRSRRPWRRDTVVLHQFPRGPWAPSGSPFPLKLETYLRMAGVTYVNDFDKPMSSKGKSPWITYNDVDMADSNFSINYLNKKLDIDLNKHLTAEQKAVAKAFQRLTEDNLFWTMVLWRWRYEPGSVFMTKTMKDMVGLLGGLVRMYVSRIANNQAWQQGIGRHTEAEVWQIAEADLMALSDFLGNKPYLTGPEPCEQDCAVFGMLAQMVWQMSDSPQEQMINDKYTNLRAYCERMKERFWPDWDLCITHDYTKKAIK